MKLYITGTKSFSKMEFLNAFNSFCQQACKKSTICSAWKKTGLIPYNLASIIDKVCKRLPFSHSTTPPLSVWLPLEKTSTSIKDMQKSMFNQLSNIFILEKFCQTWAKFAKKACLAILQKAELYKTKLKETTAAKNAWKSWQHQVNQVLQTKSILYAKDIQYMV